MKSAEVSIGCDSAIFIRFLEQLFRFSRDHIHGRTVQLVVVEDGSSLVGLADREEVGGKPERGVPGSSIHFSRHHEEGSGFLVLAQIDVEVSQVDEGSNACLNEGVGFHRRRDREDKDGFGVAAVRPHQLRVVGGYWIGVGAFSRAEYR